MQGPLISGNPQIMSTYEPTAGSLSPASLPFTLGGTVVYLDQKYVKTRFLWHLYLFWSH